MMSNPVTRTLNPGPYLDCIWGIYNTPRVILMAWELWLGSKPEEAVQPMTEEEHRNAVIAWRQCASPKYGNADLIDENMQQVAESAMEYINFWHCPEGHYFGTNDSGDYGVFPQEDEA